MFCYRSAGRSCVGFCAIVLSLLVSVSADAGMITLSTHSTNSVNPALLDATLDFQVSGSTLTLTVTNDTAAPNAFRISEVVFNATSNVTSLTPSIMPAGWSFNTNQNANSFGQFDFKVSSGNGMGSAAIVAGASVQFVFAFTGDGVTVADFLTVLSTGASRSAMVVAARFINGPPGFGNAYGGTNTPIPEPGTAALLLVAYAVSFKGRRRGPLTTTSAQR